MMQQPSLFNIEDLNPVPETGWRPPAEFPRLESAAAIAIDLETYDPELTTHGPGWGRGVGHIVGLAVGVPDGRRWYFPMRHEIGGNNMDPATVLRWAARELGREHQPKIGANLEYDVGWLAEEGVQVAGPLIDVQYAEPLLDEHRTSYSLDSLAETYLGEHKVDSVLYDWLYRAYGGKKGRWQARNIYRAPAVLVGPYAEGDVDLPLRIWEKQRPLLEKEGLTELFRMECDLIPLYIKRRMRGTRIDILRAERNREQLRLEEKEIQCRINQLAGGTINVNASKDLARLFDKAGISYPYTAPTARHPKGQPSFTAAFFKTCDHEAAKLIRELRAKEKLRSTFLENALLDKQINGRIYSQLHPLRSGDGGTVSGRYSSSQPNEQQAPSRSEEGKLLVRGVYLPEEGEDWHSLDYSQIEPRLQFHYANGPLVEALRERMWQNPSLNCYREMMRDMGEEAINGMGGWEKGYKPFKSIWLGISYQMGVPKMAAQLGVSEAQAREWRELFPPYLQELADRAGTAAEQRGYIRTLGGRLARFPFWESTDYATSYKEGAFNKEEAIRRYGQRIRRAWKHKALNRLAQGSSADIIKMAMLKMYKDGLPIPINQVHDELNFSLPKGAAGREIALEIKNIMETVVSLKVPIVAEAEYGKNWADLRPLV
jgi:DNA polymerase-1